MDLRPTTLNLFVLRALAEKPLHGYGVASWIRTHSGGELTVEEGALYHALHRMEKLGWLAADWGTSTNKRRARYYRLTSLGKRELNRERSAWIRYAALAARLLQAGRRV